MSLLIFTPTYGDGPHPAMMESVSQQQTLVPYVHEVSWHNPFPGERNMANVVAQYQRAWQLCLAGDYEALLTVEHDMVLPPDAVQKLWETDAPVVYAVYMLRHGTPTLSAWRYENRRNLGMSLSLYHADLAAFRKQGWGKVSGVGWGCTLIRRQVLEKIRVKTMAGDAGDVNFATDCVQAGISMIARFDVACDHIMPDGTLLSPFQNGGIVDRVLALADVVCSVDGHSQPLKKGSYYTLPPDVAGNLQRAGYVRFTNPQEGREQADISEREIAVNPVISKRATRKAKNALS
jgi:hypothetical protein